MYVNKNTELYFLCLGSFLFSVIHTIYRTVVCVDGVKLLNTVHDSVYYKTTEPNDSKFHLKITFGETLADVRRTISVIFFY